MCISINGTAVKKSGLKIPCGYGYADKTLLMINFWGHPVNYQTGNRKCAMT